MLTWKQAWSSASFRIQFISTLLAIACMAIAWRWFFDFLEARSGPQLNDVILNFFPAADVSWLVFFFLYGGIAISLYWLMKYPGHLLLALQTYVFVTLLRMLAITLCPLDPPIGYIPLHEPFAQLFVSDHRIISKDLFFSGHMSTICSVFFPLASKKIRFIVFLCILGVAFTVLVQHVHYTIDVLFAPAITFACYYFFKRFLKRF